MELQLGQNIRLLRKKNGFTQERLAEAVGVTVGAVYKWETGQSMPEIRLLVELAELFETSVDALLGYGWEAGGAARATQRLQNYILERDIVGGPQYARQALQKYPNNFAVVFHCAEVFYVAMTLEPSYAVEAIALYRQAIRLIDQNPYDHISLSTLENRIAMCHCFRGKVDDAIALFRKNNTEGQNEFRIGLLLSRQSGRQEEALPHLSNALSWCYASLCSVCMGYANVYFAQGRMEELEQLLSWFQGLSQGLRKTDSVCYLDRTQVCVELYLAAVELYRKNIPGAKTALGNAKTMAQRFDSAPSYDFSNIRHYAGTETARTYDDMGETALDVIENFLSGEIGQALKPLWEEICNEGK